MTADLNLYEMEKITRESALEECDIKWRADYFRNSKWTRLQTEKPKPTFSVSFKTTKKIFESQTGIELNESKRFKNYWTYVDENQIEKIKEWIKSCSIIFLRDCLSLSIALDFNFIGKSKKRSEIGYLVHKAKWSEDRNAITEIVNIVAETIDNIPYYKNADMICAVPPSSDKGFDLPSDVVQRVSKEIGKQNITNGLKFGTKKQPAKGILYHQKWDNLEEAGLSLQESDNFNVAGKTIILIDDLYQSGITMQYVAMRLQQAGACQIYGLCFVKTRGDKDNRNA